MMPLVKIRSKKIFQDLLTLRNRLKQENTLYLKAVLARKASSGVLNFCPCMLMFTLVPTVTAAATP